MERKPLVSIIIPARNEEKFIDKCLKSLVSNSYENKEIIVVDGMSKDRTREIVKKYEVRLIDNPERYTSYALNLGIKNAKGQIVMIAGAHTTYSENYISSCVDKIVNDKCEISGGQVITFSGSNTSKAKAIASVISHPFGVGNSKYRINFNKEAYVDTVAYGLYKKELFEKVGLFNEKLIRNQDIEMNLRLKKSGARIMLVPEAKAFYYARDKIISLMKNNFGNGFWVIMGRKYAKYAFSIRHLVPFVFVIFLISMLFLFNLLKWIYLPVLSVYFLLDLFSSIQIGIKNKSFKIFFWGLIIFPILHVSYGLGSLWGLLSFVLKKANKEV
ncbi:MAG: glycosyltransferase family 2 protein [Thermosipho sp. (in: Bacteria)]|nr:glycosyltransferase family 2 protein [Thermosipho sp. (in: thermotogales)]